MKKFLFSIIALMSCVTLLGHTEYQEPKSPSEKANLEINASQASEQKSETAKKVELERYQVLIKAELTNFLNHIKESSISLALLNRSVIHNSDLRYTFWKELNRDFSELAMMEKNEIVSDQEFSTLPAYGKQTIQMLCNENSCNESLLKILDKLLQDTLAGLECARLEDMISLKDASTDDKRKNHNERINKLQELITKTNQELVEQTAQFEQELACKESPTEIEKMLLSKAKKEIFLIKDPVAAENRNLNEKFSEDMNKIALTQMKEHARRLKKENPIKE